MSKQKTCIVVLGMHRSGTSVFTGVLQRTGLELGKDLLPPLPENPKGFYENAELYKINEVILEQLNTSWDTLGKINWNTVSAQKKEQFKTEIKKGIKEQFGDKQLIGIKDPRMAVLLPLYHDCLLALDYNIKYLNINRDCLEVANSLKRRNNFSLIKGYALCKFCKNQIKLNLEAFNLTPIITFNIKTFFADPLDILKQVKLKAEIDINTNVEKEINEFIDPNLINNIAKENFNFNRLIISIRSTIYILLHSKTL